MTGSSSLRLIDLVRVDAQCIMHLLRKRDMFSRDFVLTKCSAGQLNSFAARRTRVQKFKLSTNDFILREEYKWRLGKNASGGK